MACWFKVNPFSFMDAGPGQHSEVASFKVILATKPSLWMSSNFDAMDFTAGIPFTVPQKAYELSFSKDSWVPTAKKEKKFRAVHSFFLYGKVVYLSKMTSVK